jgi:hypothetical protein
MDQYLRKGYRKSGLTNNWKLFKTLDLIVDTERRNLIVWACD